MQPEIRNCNTNGLREALSVVVHRLQKLHVYRELELNEQGVNKA